MAHRIAQWVFWLGGVVCIALAGGNFLQLNKPGAPGVISFQALWFIGVPIALWVVIGFFGWIHRAYARSIGKLGSTVVDNGEANLAETRAALGKHADDAIARGNTDEARRCCDAADVVANKLKAGAK